jgi:tellurite resistance protein
MPADDGPYEVIEVPVHRKIEINLSLDDLVNAVVQQATASGQVSQDALQRLQQLGQLADQLKSRMGQSGGQGGGA